MEAFLLQTMFEVMIVYLFSFMVNNHWVLLNRIETMKTYNTYQEAKIANPDQDISVSMSKVFAASSYVSNILLSGCVQGWNKCNPADHCMTVEKFLADGHKFVDGDIYLNSSGRTLGVVNIPDYNNKRSTIDCDLYILHAAALETKEPKRTKKVYEVVGRDLNAWEFLKAYSELPDSEQWFIKVSGDQYAPIHDWFVVAETLRAHSFVYQRIETPIEWWEDAAEFINQHGFAGFADGKLEAQVSMTRDQWCDFARILLEQGE
ncbi:hypothetical protein NVP1013O_11 [Vibrio phage 1.013.O._10N.286.54.F9]|nr:hypothetical protein NVP1013O_11 [Vibrio phage 1.013.O._10N.286.54.F9]